MNAHRGLSPVQSCVWTHVSKEPHIVGPHHADRSVCDLQDTEDARLAVQQVRSHAPGRGGERLASRRPYTCTLAELAMRGLHVHRPMIGAFLVNSFRR